MKVKFLPQNISVDIQSGKSVMELARENKLPVSSSCNGMCSCAECRVYVVEGEAHILPPSAKEVDLIGGGYFIDSRRLSCQLFCFGDVTIDLSEQVEREKQGGTVNKQFLKQISKNTMADSSSLGGILVEDQEINKIHIPEEGGLNISMSLKDELYQDQKTRFSKGKQKENQKRTMGEYSLNRKKRKKNRKSHYRKKRNYKNSI